MNFEIKLYNRNFVLNDILYKEAVLLHIGGEYIFKIEGEYIISSDYKKINENRNNKMAQFY